MQTPHVTSWRPRWLSALTLMMCALALTACAHGTRPAPAPIPPELLRLLQPLQSIDQVHLRPCPTPAPATDDRVTTLLRHHVEVGAPLATACRERHRGLVEAVRERERIEKERVERANRAIQGE